MVDRLQFLLNGLCVFKIRSNGLSCRLGLVDLLICSQYEKRTLLPTYVRLYLPAVGVLLSVYTISVELQLWTILPGLTCSTLTFICLC